MGWCPGGLAHLPGKQGGAAVEPTGTQVAALNDALLYSLSMGLLKLPEHHPVVLPLIDQALQGYSSSPDVDREELGVVESQCVSIVTVQTEALA